MFSLSESLAVFDLFLFSFYTIRNKIKGCGIFFECCILLLTYIENNSDKQSSYFRDLLSIAISDIFLYSMYALDFCGHN